MTTVAIDTSVAMYAAGGARAVRDLLPVDGQVMQEAVRQYEALPDLSARDILHVATCVAHGIDRIVSVDTDFDGLEAVTRVDPADLAGTEGDIAGQ